MFRDVSFKSARQIHARILRDVEKRVEIVENVKKVANVEKVANAHGSRQTPVLEQLRCWAPSLYWLLSQVSFSVQKDVCIWYMV